MMVRILLLCITLVVVSGHVSAQSRSTSWLKGTWTGTGYQIDNDETWTMRLKVTGTKYLVEYPSLNCGGIWKLISIGRYSATFKEYITHNKVDCTDRGHVTIERLNSDQVNFRYRNPGATEFIASGILKKQRR